MSAEFGYFDAAVLVIILVSALLAFMRGFTREVLAIISWIIAAVATIKLFPVLRPLAQGYIEPDWIADALTGSIVFFAVLLVVSAFTYRWAQHVYESSAGTLDRSLGLLFGGARGLLIVVIAYMGFAFFVPVAQHPEWVKNARTMPVIARTGEALLAALPEDQRRFGTAPLSPLASGDTAPVSEATNGNGVSGYTENDTREMDRLFDLVEED